MDHYDNAQIKHKIDNTLHSQIRNKSDHYIYQASSFGMTFSDQQYYD